MGTLAVRHDDLAAKVGTRTFIALPREEVERWYASIEVVDESDHVPLVTFTVVHHNYRWLTFGDSLGILDVPAMREPPLLFDEQLEAVARRSVERTLPGAQFEVRPAGLMAGADLALLYVAKLTRAPHGRETTGNGDLLQRTDLDPRSRLVVANLSAL